MHQVATVKTAPNNLNLNSKKSKPTKLAEVTTALSKKFQAKVKNSF